MNKMLKSPLFIIGLGIRLLMLYFVLPKAAASWYVPFMDITASEFTVDPWSAFLANGGSEAAFPYGYVMWFLLLPITLLGKLFSIDGYIAYGLSLLTADVVMLFTLKKLYRPISRQLLFTYWLSPIVVFATYWLGYNDLIPVTLLALALYFLRELKLLHAGALCAAAMSAKLSMALAVPFFFIYLYRNRSLQPSRKQFLFGVIGGLVITYLPFALSRAGLGMLFNNPEVVKIYQLVVEMGSNSHSIYVLPLVYMLMLYLTWRIRRISFQLLNVLLGMSFFLVVLLTPASPGWFIWIIPMLVCFQAMSGKVTMIVTSAFTALYVFSALLGTQSPLIAGHDVASLVASRSNYLLGVRGVGILHTFLFALGLILLFRIWREAVINDEYFRRSRKPFSIGIAGDSGAGKDTLVASIEGLFGSHSVVNLSGDDYHLWDRTKPIWQVMTHLNPKANDLEQYAKDLIALTNDKSIQSRHYDHASGRRSHPHRIDSNDIIIASGLHALHLPILRSCYDLSIYLDIDENLRRHFKVERDVNKRGHSFEKVLSSIAKREVDSQKFVRPQVQYADLVLCLQPIHPRMLEGTDDRHPLRLKLVARSRHGFNEESLVRVLVGVCGLHVDMLISADGSEVELSIEGETSPEDIAMAAQVLFPEIREFLDTKPRWDDGIQGLMQLVSLSHISQAFKKRLI